MANLFLYQTEVMQPSTELHFQLSSLPCFSGNIHLYGKLLTRCSLQYSTLSEKSDMPDVDVTKNGCHILFFLFKSVTGEPIS